MDLRLEKLVEGLETLADIRNLDQHNPVIVMLEHPVTRTQYVHIASIVEPSYLAIPIYSNWVVFNPDNPYYKRVLKLLSRYPDEPGSIAGFNCSWKEILHYDELFDPVQLYDVGDRGPRGEKGDTGPAGPVGPVGPKGDPGTDGVIGKDGAVGPKGEKGDTGEIGPRGLTGEKGDTGPAGTNGIDGTPGAKGDTGPAGPAGPAGQDAVAVNATTNVYGRVKLSTEDPTSTAVSTTDPRLSDSRSPTTHEHPASEITVVDIVGSNFGTPLTAESVSAINLQLILGQLLNKKAAKTPVYSSTLNLPAANTVEGMFAYVSGVPYFSNGQVWKKLKTEDDTLHYDMGFSIFDALGVDKTIGSILLPRNRSVYFDNIEAPLNSKAFANIAPTSSYSFSLKYITNNTTYSLATVTFAAGEHVGSFTWGPLAPLIVQEGSLIQLNTHTSQYDPTLFGITITLVGCVRTTPACSFG